MYRNKALPPHRARRKHGQPNDRPRPGDGPHLKCYRCSNHRIAESGNNCTICGLSNRVMLCTGPSRLWHGQSLLMALADIPPGPVWHHGCTLCDRSAPQSSKGPRVYRPKQTTYERRGVPPPKPPGEPWLWDDEQASAWLALASRADKVQVIRTMKRRLAIAQAAKDLLGRK